MPFWHSRSASQHEFVVTSSAKRAKLVGREAELEAVLKGLHAKRCVIFTGGPGEGRTALALEAVQSLLDQEALPGGALTVDLAGKKQMHYY